MAASETAMMAEWPDLAAHWNDLPNALSGGVLRGFRSGDRTPHRFEHAFPAPPTEAASA
jgi:hypothetical protein